MAKTCINCGRQLGLFSGNNMIIEGPERALCDNCFKPFGVYVNKLRNRTSIDGLVEAKNQAINAIESSTVSYPAKTQVIHDVETLYKERCGELKIDNEEIDEAEKKRIVITKREEEMAQAYKERYITYAEIAGTRMAENGIGLTINSTSYSVLIFYNNGDIELHEGDADSIKPFLPYMRPKCDMMQLASAVNRLETAINNIITCIKNS